MLIRTLIKPKMSRCGRAVLRPHDRNVGTEEEQIISEERESEKNSHNLILLLRFG